MVEPAKKIYLLHIKLGLKFFSYDGPGVCEREKSFPCILNSYFRFPILAVCLIIWLLFGELGMLIWKILALVSVA